jgi:hypothetical protein
VLQITHPVTKRTYRFWWSQPTLSKPIKEDAPAAADNRLFPWECRDAVGDWSGHSAPVATSSISTQALYTSTQGITYKGPFHCTLNWACDDTGAQGSFVKKWVPQADGV